MSGTSNLKLYWLIWGVLLALTLVMLLLDQAPLPRALFVVMIVGAMLLKAALIAAYFMHLRFERVALAASVLVGLVINATILYGLILPDALRILGMASSG